MKMIKEYLNFIIDPKKLTKNKRNVKEILISYIFFVVSYLIISFLFSYLMFLLNIEINFNSHTKTVLGGEILFLSLVVAPISEELLFRAILKPNKVTFSLFIFSILFFLFRSFEVILYLNIILSIGLSLLVSCKTETNVSSFIHNNLVKIIYISAFLFAFFHLFNFKLENSLFTASIFLLIPKVYLAFALCFSRMKYGLLNSILLHSLINGVLIYIGSL